MANEVYQRESLIVGKSLAVGRVPGESLIGDFDFVGTDAAVLVIVSPDSSTSKIVFADNNPDAAQLIFSHSTDEFEFEIGGTTEMFVRSGAVEISGDLIVRGTTTTVESTTVTFGDNILELNTDLVGAPPMGLLSGLEVNRGSSTTVGWVYEESNNRWRTSGAAVGIHTDYYVTSGGPAQGSLPPTDFNHLTRKDYVDAALDAAIPAGVDNSIVRYNGTEAVQSSGAFVSDTGTISAAPGSTSAVTFGFIGNTNTGMYSPATSTVAIVAGGTEKVRVNATGVDFLNMSVQNPLDPTTDDMIGDRGYNDLRYVAQATFQEQVEDFVGGMVTGNTENDIQVVYDDGTGKLNFTVLFPSPTITLSGGVTGSGTLTQLMSANIVTTVSNDSHTHDSRYYTETESDARFLQVDGSNQIAGTITPAVNNTFNFGSTSNKFATIYATTFEGTATSALYADIAERYEADAVYEPGTVVVFGGEKEITITEQEEDTRVAGVISTAPAFMMNAEAGTDETHPYVALKGKVPCKVIGTIRKGDLLVTASVPGYGQSMGVQAGAYTAFARALEDHDGYKGVIMVSIT